MSPTQASRLTALLIDHDDSFTYNVKAWLSARFLVDVAHHLDIKKISASKNYHLIVFSPGPKSPTDYPHSLQKLLNTNPDQHVLGICLGLQMMTIVENGEVTTYTPPLHGKTSALLSSAPALNGKKVARYHSMICQIPEKKFKVVASADGHAMWVQHKTKRWMGFQFHPESFLTEDPDLYLKALTDWVHA
jgi:anthranilate/para-aminobenzoate synthase component II